MNKVIACLAVVAAMSAGSAFADEGQVSKSALKAFGLPSLRVVSDEQGMQIRGARSFALVFGVSSSDGLGNNDASHGYTAGAAHFFGGSSAQGRSISVSGGAAGITGLGAIWYVTGSAGGAQAQAF